MFFTFDSLRGRVLPSATAKVYNPAVGNVLWCVRNVERLRRVSDNTCIFVDHPLFCNRQGCQINEYPKKVTENPERRQGRKPWMFLSGVKDLVTWRAHPQGGLDTSVRLCHPGLCPWSSGTVASMVANVLEATATLDLWMSSNRPRQSA